MREPPRSMTDEELRDALMAEARRLVDYWSRTKLDPEEDNVKSRISGAIFSFLSVLDGVSCQFPCGFSLQASVGDGHKDAMIELGQNWIEEGTSLGSFMLHDCLYLQPEKRTS